MSCTDVRRIEGGAPLNLTVSRPSIEGAPELMLTQGEDVEVHALRQRGWSISAIARHLDRDRKTVRAYLRGERQPGAAGQRGARIRWPRSWRT